MSEKRGEVVVMRRHYPVQPDKSANTSWTQLPDARVARAMALALRPDLLGMPATVDRDKAILAYLKALGLLSKTTDRRDVDYGRIVREAAAWVLPDDPDAIPAGMVVLMSELDGIAKEMEILNKRAARLTEQLAAFNDLCWANAKRTT